MHYLHIHSGVVTVCMLILSNVFMTFAWYAHLKNLSSMPWFGAALASWGIAFFEYMIQVPACSCRKENHRPGIPCKT